MSHDPVRSMVPSLNEGETVPSSPERKQPDLEAEGKNTRFGGEGDQGHLHHLDNDSNSTIDANADEGVTRIEALCEYSAVIPRLQEMLIVNRSGIRERLETLHALGQYCSNQLVSRPIPKRCIIHQQISVFSLSNATTYGFLPFATSAFQTHSLLGTIGVINSLIAAVSQPFIAKICDLVSRPFALTGAVVLYALGFIVVAASKNVRDVAGGEVLYTMGNTGLQLVQLIIMADLTNMRNRGWVVGAVSLPWVVNTFVSGFIIVGISGYTLDGWRWGVSDCCVRNIMWMKS